MKKTLALVLAVLAICLTSCTTTPATTPATTSATDVISVEEAVNILKEDINASIPGYHNDNGYLRGPENGIYLHYDSYEGNYDYIVEQIDCSYVIKNNKISCYQFGEVIATATIDSEAIYCGKSGAGLIFRLQDKVLLVRIQNLEVEEITSEVKFVVATNYQFTGDFENQILLLMTDGSLKVYIEGVGLQSPRYEGGYGGTYID